jgi:hypothetical protein
MCQFASFYLTNTSEYWGPTESHTDIIERHGLVEDGCRGPNGVRVEIIPPASGQENLSTWHYRLDQDVLPDWAEADMARVEERARSALVRRAFAEKWMVTESGDHVLVGYGGTATAGDYGTATACYGGTATAGKGGMATAGKGGTATAGYGGTATAGERGTATAGDYGTATAGYGGTATVGDYGTATAGDDGTATVGKGGMATAGYGGTATAGYGGTATAGYGGTATAGDYGTATAGDGGKATAGYGGTATAGYGGVVCVWWHDGTRRRLCVEHVGEGGVKPNVKYCVCRGKLTPA